jgi:hypothetical protein
MRATALRGVRLHVRRERRDLHREVGPRQRPQRVHLERPALGPAGRRLGQGVERLGAALRVAVGLGLRHGRLAEQIDRGGGAVAPQLAQDPERLAGRLAHDEAVRHVPHAARRGGAQGGAARLGRAHPHGHVERRRPLPHLAEVAGEVARQVVERAAGGRHVHEAKQRRPQLGVLRGELHGLRVERLHRAHPPLGEGRIQRPPDSAELFLYGRVGGGLALGHGRKLLREEGT